MLATAVLARITPLSDFSAWARSSLLLIILYLVGAVLVTRLATWTSGVVTRHIDVQSRAGDALVRSEAAKHRHAVTAVITWTFLVLVYCITGVLVIQRLGVPITSLVAPATVAGVAVGFGAQRVVQDVLAGFFIITERQYGFGDLIRIAPLGDTGGVTGTVEELTLRSTRIRSPNGEVITIPNGQIVQLTNLSRDWARAVVDVPVPVTADVNRVTAVLHKVGEDAFADEKLRPLLLDEPSVMGVESLQVDQLQVRMVARTQPGRQFEVGRELRSRVALELRRLGITLPPAVDTGDPSATA